MQWERAGGQKTLVLKSQTLEFGVEYGGKQKTAEINEAYLRRVKSVFVQLGEAGHLGKGHYAPHECSGSFINWGHDDYMV